MPTPLSFSGKKFVAGKTENCMSHPDIRGTGVYFPHEKKYFELAKNRFKVFFTTAGDIAKGAPGRVREKLGYRAFDDWEIYSVWIYGLGLRQKLLSMIMPHINNNKFIGRILSYFLELLIRMFYHQTEFPLTEQFRIFNDKNVPLSHLEKLWMSNKTIYGITVERTAQYLTWRLKDNPYNNHNYFCYYENDVLKGYLVVVSDSKVFYIVDIFADNKDERIFKLILKGIREYAYQKGIIRVQCSTIKRSRFLPGILKSAGFVNFKELLGFQKRVKPKQLFVYLPDEIKKPQNSWDPRNWYVTDLIKEGRPYLDKSND